MNTWQDKFDEEYGYFTDPFTRGNETLDDLPDFFTDQIAGYNKCLTDTINYLETLKLKWNFINQWEKDSRPTTGR